MRDTMLVKMGPYELGEVPEKIEITACDKNGSPLNLANGTDLKFRYSVDKAAAEDGIANFTNPALGVLEVTWSVDAFDTGGILRGRVWCNLDGARPILAKIYCEVLPPPVTID